MKHFLWVVGPSGAGKSFLLDALRQGKHTRTLDLDFLGYRREGEGWQKWHIPQESLGMLAQTVKDGGGPLVVAGISTEGEAMLDHAITMKYRVVAIIPTARDLEANRRKRGDADDKVREAPNSVAAWGRIAKKHALEVFESATDLLTVLTSEYPAGSRR